MDQPEVVGRGADGPNHGRRRGDRVIAPPPWRVELERQERSLGWLARHTGKSTSAVSRYANGTLPTPAEWLQDVARILGPKAVAA